MNRYMITREKIKGQEYLISALYDEKKHMIEVLPEAAGETSLLGNIYVGKVENIVTNLNAAFVKIAPDIRCYLPLSDNMTLSKALGTRHRAAVGVSEATDSVTLVVSEETGRVSVAVSGRLKSVKDGDELRDILSVLVKRETENTGRFRIWKGRRRNERKADK